MVKNRCVFLKLLSCPICQFVKTKLSKSWHFYSVHVFVSFIHSKLFQLPSNSLSFSTAKCCAQKGSLYYIMCKFVILFCFVDLKTSSADIHCCCNANCDTLRFLLNQPIHSIIFARNFKCWIKCKNRLSKNSLRPPIFYQCLLAAAAENNYLIKKYEKKDPFPSYFALKFF